MAGEANTIIIGAGPAGLAVAASLRARNVSCVVLERADHVGSSWHRHYERLHLHTPKSHSALPYLDYPRDCPRYPSRDDFIAYLDRYARAFAIKASFGENVIRREHRSDYWTVVTEENSWHGRHLVVASGLNRVPHAPSWPGQGSFGGPILHSSAYVNGERFRGQRVLIVGFGNSGAEIALDLHEHGAHPAISLRGPANVVPREVLGIPSLLFALATRSLPPGVADRLNALTIRLAVGDLTRLGIRNRAHGPLVQILEHGQIPVIDVGTIAAIRRGSIQLRPAIDRFDADTVCFADGGRERFDAVILATGFRTGLQSLLPENPEAIDAAGRPRQCGPPSAPAGLHFCGFKIVSTGSLREIAIEATQIADRIASHARRH